MAAPNSVWGIDVGQCALKAVKLGAIDEQVQVEAFEVIEHSEVLSQPDVDTAAVIQASLDQFLQRQDVSESSIAVSVLGQSSITRFVKLPPVEKKKIPDIVRFEAEQQIPFPLEEVIWRYQTFEDPDSPDVEAGIFAMKRTDVQEMLAHFLYSEMDVDMVQMAPLSLYNFMCFDKQCAEGGATLLADVGADKTHLVVADGSRIWTRTIRIGGNNFTEALVRSFKLSFEKAEKLKRTAANSKYARQIFQVMRPVFADLVQEIQRSIGYYTSLHRESRFVQLKGMGNGFRLPGMHKYLEQNLNIPVSRVKSFHSINAPKEFKDHVLSFGVAYGLAVQGLGKAAVQTNLLPETIAKKRLWDQKRPWFAAAAAALVLGVGVMTLRSVADANTLKDPGQVQQLQQAERILTQLNSWKRQASEIDSNLQPKQEEIQRYLELNAYAKTWPTINTLIAEAVYKTVMGANWEREMEILQQFEHADEALRRQLASSRMLSDQTRLRMIEMLPYSPSDEEGTPSLREQLIQQLGQKSRQSRSVLILEEQLSEFHGDLSQVVLRQETVADAGGRSGSGGRPSPSARRRGPIAPTGGGPAAQKGYRITLVLRTPLPQSEAINLIGNLRAKLSDTFQTRPDLVTMLEKIPVFDVVTSSSSMDVGGGSRGTRGGSGGSVRGTLRANSIARTSDSQADGVQIENEDPLFSGESLDEDNLYKLEFRLAVVGDGLPEENDPQAPNAGR